jgi:nicotinamidase/pyrazinamidase
MSKILIVVDMLNDFVDPDGALFFESGASIVPAVKRRIVAHRAEGNKIIYINDAHDKDDKEFDRFPPHAIAGTWGAEILAELVPEKADIVITKKRYSGFYGTNLDVHTVHALDAEVEVVGVATSICIMDTVGGLANRDIPVTVPADAVSDFDQVAHRFALSRMASIYGANVTGL